MFLRLRKTGLPRLDASCQSLGSLWGPAPRPPGIYRFDPNPEAGNKRSGVPSWTPRLGLGP
jgi:hypothetical protein